MSTQIDLGPVLSIPKGDWDVATTYERLNMVRHNSAAWICNVATSTGVEPTEDSTDWYLQVKDTSSVTSVNGMKGDVVIELTETETPPADDNSNRIATTEWVTDKLGDVDLSGIKDDTILAAQKASSLEVGTGELTSAELAAVIENNNNVLRALITDIGEEVNAAKNSMPVGTVIAFSANSEPPGGYLLCNGAAVSRTTYATLFATIGTTYGAGDGSSTFNLPDLSYKFIQGDPTAGIDKKAGLPNIVGSARIGGASDSYGSWYDTYGAFVQDTITYNGRFLQIASNSGTVAKAAFFADKYNATYGNSETVQPPALTMRYYIKY